ncbi:beta/gamma crystallin-related protein [Edwardsiella ictaluri]|uniref:beta/gamma crystallin-related protein n=1 Tax=Edwardsiella ictaluri TaxID=67780 RepID=UPI0039F68D8E
MSGGRERVAFFCRPKDASCSTTTLDEGYSQGADRLMVYEDSSQRGASLSIDRDIPDLSRYRFADRISSFSVPQGWTVRFYEGTDYSGGYYTRSGGEQEATGFNDHIRSIRILNR